MIVHCLSIFVLCQGAPAPKQGFKGGAILAAPSVKSQTSGVLAAPKTTTKTAGVLAAPKTKSAAPVVGTKNAKEWVTITQMAFDARNQRMTTAKTFLIDYELEAGYEIAKYGRWQSFMDNEIAKKVRRLPAEEGEKLIRKYLGLPPMNEDGTQDF